MNEVHLVGRIATEIRRDEFNTRSGMRPKASFLMAIPKPRKEVTEPDWVRVETWGVQAENVVKFCGKGSRIAVSGRLRGEFYNPDGKARGGQLRVVVVADAITYLSAPSGRTAETSGKGAK